MSIFKESTGFKSTIVTAQSIVQKSAKWHKSHQQNGDRQMTAQLWLVPLAS